MAADETPEPELPNWGDWTALPTALIEREIAAMEDAAAQRGAEMALEVAETLFADALADGPLAAITSWAELDPMSARVLALCATVEMDRRLQRLVDRLVGPPAAGRVTIELAVRLLGPDALAALYDDGELCRAALIDMEPDAPFAAAHLSVPRPVLWRLLDGIALDPELDPDAEIITVDPRQIGLHDLLLVHGADRVRRVSAAAAGTTGLAFLLTTPPANQEGWRTLVRQASVAGLGLILECDGPPGRLTRYWIDRASHLAVALCSREPLPLESLPRRPFAEIEAGAAPVTDAEWRAAFPGADLPRRRPGAQQLRLAARAGATGLDPEAAVRRLTAATLLKHATRIQPNKGWDELVLPPTQLRQLRGLAARYRQRAVVHEDWELPLYPSPGVVAMFAGPSGTGKTTAAEVIAADLGVEMFRVDLSALVSKYIGETEKNLEEIFAAAHASEFLLLFDEADALFGKRSDVSDARDRYANMEVSYLLQRLETFDGFVILTSNFQGNIDEAFLRRIHLTVHFSVPEAADRRRIWERSLKQAPRVDLDLGFVAEKFDLTGGSIRLAALSAAFLAADRGSAIEMIDILRAVTAEMRKLRRRPSNAQYGPWLEAVLEAEGRPVR